MSRTEKMRADRCSAPSQIPVLAPNPFITTDTGKTLLTSYSDEDN
jgi:hypothetical protein